MGEWLNVDWNSILVPQHALEIFIRGTLVYFGLLFILRVILKKQQSSNLASSDLLVTVLIADAIQNGMAGEYKSVPDGLLLVTTIVVWNYITDWLAFHFTWVHRLVVPPPTKLIENGKMLRRNMRRELVSEKELWIELRQNEVEDLSEVKSACLEPNGELSVIKNKK